jgi:polyferredoxin
MISSEERDVPTKPFRARRSLQVAVAALVAVIGAQFTVWVLAHVAGRWPAVPRPPGVEAFLPIGSMLALRHWLASGIIDPVHPAGLAILLGVLGASLLVAKSFCSHLCPIGLLSEWTGRLGQHFTRRRVDLPPWIDVPLRGAKYGLLAFFMWAIWLAMDADAIAAFLASPYYTIADAKMWHFFAPPSSTTVIVLGILLAASFVVRDFWCRYLCPYGALLGLVGVLAPFKVTRDASRCTDCRACSRACPARLPVHQMGRMTSPECTSCQDCIAACPVEGCLTVRLPKPARRVPALRPALVATAVVAIFFGTLLAFRVAGHWHSGIEEAEMHRHLQRLDSPVYSHDAAMSAPQQAPTRDGS